MNNLSEMFRATVSSQDMNTRHRTSPILQMNDNAQNNNKNSVSQQNSFHHHSAENTLTHQNALHHHSAHWNNDGEPTSSAFKSPVFSGAQRRGRRRSMQHIGGEVQEQPCSVRNNNAGNSYCGVLSHNTLMQINNGSVFQSPAHLIQESTFRPMSFPGENIGGVVYYVPPPSLSPFSLASPPIIGNSVSPVFVPLAIPMPPISPMMVPGGAASPVIFDLGYQPVYVNPLHPPTNEREEMPEVTECTPTSGHDSSVSNGNPSSFQRQQTSPNVGSNEGFLSTNFIVPVKDHSSAENAVSSTSTSRDQFRCQVCQKDMSSKSTLMIHVNIHTGDRPYVCDLVTCGKRFRTKDSLIKHQRVHSGEKPYTCDICDKKFTQNSSWRLHMKIHSGDRAFECHICHKSFTQKGNLISHIRTHTGEKPFKCPLPTCKKRFAQQGQLRKHLRQKEKSHSSSPEATEWLKQKI